MTPSLEGNPASARIVAERSYEVRVSRAQGAQTYEVRLGERATVLDALIRIQSQQDASLTFRFACRVGMCGTCAMYINHVPRLACQTRLTTLGSARVKLAPLPHLPVVQDLVVSLAPFMEQWKRIKPALHPRAEGYQGPAAESGSGKLALLPPDEVTQSKRDCITCGICYAACGVTGTQKEFLGPAAVNKAFLRLADPRDGAREERLRALNDERSGVWRCHTQYNCTMACPKRIDLTDTLGRLKRRFIRG